MQYELFEGLFQASRLGRLRDAPRQWSRRRRKRKGFRVKRMDVKKAVREHIFELLGNDVPGHSLAAGKALALFPHYLRFLEARGMSDV